MGAFIIRNHRAKFDEKYLKCSLHETLPKLFKAMAVKRNNNLSETIKPRVLKFGVQHPQEDLYQGCSKYVPGVEIGPTLRVIRFYLDIKTIKNLLYKSKIFSLGLRP